MRRTLARLQPGIFTMATTDVTLVILQIMAAIGVMQQPLRFKKGNEVVWINQSGFLSYCIYFK